MLDMLDVVLIVAALAVATWVFVVVAGHARPHRHGYDEVAVSVVRQYNRGAQRVCRTGISPLPRLPLAPPPETTADEGPPSTP